MAYVAAVPVVVWLNGPFGVGKTTTASLLAEGSTRLRPFDPEWVGYMLRANLSERSLGGDFQHLPAWRRLVPIVAREIVDTAGQDLVAVQTVLVQTYWEELSRGLKREGFDVLHILLDADSATLAARIDADTTNGSDEARRWRLDHIETFESNRRWMAAAADVVIDTRVAATADVAGRILETYMSRT